jgi:K+ transporter
VLGVLSLFFWSLFMVVMVKYELFIMRFDNRGDGVIPLALNAALGNQFPADRAVYCLNHPMFDAQPDRKWSKWRKTLFMFFSKCTPRLAL